MGLRAALASPPDGYEVVRGRRGVLVVERARRERLERAGFGPDGGEALAASDLSGRSPLGAIDAGPERWIVRHHHHGGALRILGERLYLDPARPFHELDLSERLRLSGIATPRVVAARAVRDRPFGWRLALVTVRVEGASEVAVELERVRRGELGARARARLFRLVGAHVGTLHRAGFAHADLTPRNVLLTREPDLAWILDLDRGRLGGLDDGARRDNLWRLYRSVRRREARGRSFLTRADYRRFLAGYGEALGRAASWRADWGAIVARERWRGPLHRLGWFVEEHLGSGPEARDGGAVVRG